MSSDIAARTAAPGTVVNINYHTATTGPNKYVSCVIENSSGTVLYYGKLTSCATNAAGTASFTVPSGLAPGSYQIILFSEEANGDNFTDFAGSFVYITLTVVLPPTPDANGIVYVTETGDGTMDGSSWGNAYAGLANPLLVADYQRKGTIATATSDTIRQIWVAAGAYQPQHKAGNGSTDRDKAFVLVNNVKIYGGFAGTETSIDDRDWVTNVTTLSGVIGTTGTAADSVYHVIIGAAPSATPITAATVLDGFTVTGGNAIGGGAVSVNGQTVARYHGGGIHNNNSSPTLTNVTVRGNTADYGGGIYNAYSSPTISNATINGNTANTDGGGMYVGRSSPTLTNVIISGNNASHFGGGISNNQSTLTLTNVTVSGNTAITAGSGINNYITSPTLNNTIVWGNTGSNNITNEVGDEVPIYNYSLVQGLNPGGTNLDGTLVANNPLFVSLASAAPTTSGDYRLQQGSPCINAGDTVAYKTARSITGFTGEKDAAGIDRLQHVFIDMGAYESPYKGTVQRATVALPDRVYGTALAPTLTGGSNPGKGDTLYIYATSQTGVYAPTPVPQNAGTYWVKGVTVETTATYADTTAAVSFRITPATLTVTPTANQSKVYGDADPIYAYTPTGFENGDNASILTGALSRATGEIVGDYLITQGNLSAGGNYTISLAPETFAITPATLTITPTANQSKIYGAADPIYAYTPAGFENGDNASILTGALDRATGENVGDYLITQGNLSAGGNYTIILAPETFAITAASQTTPQFADHTAIAKTYGNVPFNLPTVTGGESTGTYSYRSGNTAVATVNASSGQVTIHSTGTAVIYVKRLGDGNYTDSGEDNITVNVAQATGTLVISQNDIAYGTLLSPQIVSKTGDGTVSYQYKMQGADDATYSATPPTAVGLYTVRGQAAATLNYTAATSAPVDFAIIITNQTTPQFADHTAIEKVFGDNEPFDLPAVTGGQSTGDYSYRSSDPSVATVDAVTGQVTILGAGSAVIYVKKLGDGNYTDSAEDYITVNVAKANYIDITHNPLVILYTGTNTLADVEGLQAGFSWINPNEKLEIGTGSHAARYNADPNNYNDFLLNITVHVSEVLYNITVAETVNGKVTPWFGAAPEGLEVFMRVTPEKGYEFADFKIYQTGNEKQTIKVIGDGYSRTFYMPAYDVTITATFKPTVLTGIADVETGHAQSCSEEINIMIIN